ncbi:hypothetical protein [Microbaculum marinum]|uniref:Uncharacterized protein n=1 Tax=Microbaculum marinum TaxID=1764581 RepID=A0AAW9RE28_9HYPH
MKRLVRYLSLVLFTLVLAGADFAHAQGPGSYARRTGPLGGPLRLEANFVAGDTCQAALSAKRGAPAGQAIGPDTIPVTIVIGPNPKGCGTSRVVTRIMTLGGPKEINIIQIFFVNPAGRILKVERISAG